MMTEKQIAFKWLAQQTDPQKVAQLDVRADLEQLGAKGKALDQAELRVRSEIEKWRERFTDYLNRRGA